jgi:hypothetical protein
MAPMYLMFSAPILLVTSSLSRLTATTRGTDQYNVLIKDLTLAAAVFSQQILFTCCDTYVLKSRTRADFLSENPYRS